MSYFVFDAEADGPVPPLYSMVWFGTVRVDEDLTTTFAGTCRPISDQWLPKALSVCGLTREETLAFSEPAVVIPAFVSWVHAHNDPGTQPQLISDNNGFDWGFLNYYLWRYAGENPFGHTSHNLSDLYRGLAGKMHSSLTHLRRTVHDHDPVNDAIGNAEALLAMREAGLQLTP